jgi:excisionase family DNA binding protein
VARRMDALEERYITLPAVAERLSVSRRTVYRWIKSGDLNAYKFANEYRIAESDLQDFLERHRTRPKE